MENERSKWKWLFTSIIMTNWLLILLSFDLSLYSLGFHDLKFCTSYCHIAQMKWMSSNSTLTEYESSIALHPFLICWTCTMYTKFSSLSSSLFLKSMSQRPPQYIGFGPHAICASSKNSQGFNLFTSTSFNQIYPQWLK
jgi:hypothetical protein